MSAEVERQQMARYFQRPYEDLSVKEKLWYFRTTMEKDHRIYSYLVGVMRTYEPSVYGDKPASLMGTQNIIDACNKLVPVYILKGRGLLGAVLHNYIYRRWFQPYKSDIEHERFVCKFIAPKDIFSEALPSLETINSIISLNKAMCAEVNDRRSTLKNHQFHILQPLFQALLIIISEENYNNDDSKSVGRLPVYLVRTGVVDNLSAPITFEAIADKIDGYIGTTGSIVKITLEIAIDFVIHLGAQEAKVYGLQPDPVASWDPDLYECLSTFEWRELLGVKTLKGPTSRFIDIDEYPKWAGPGQEFDSTAMVINEQRQRWQNGMFHRPEFRVLENWREIPSLWPVD